MTDLRTAAQQALEALEHVVRQAQENLVPTIHYGPVHDVMNNLRAALAQQAEPDTYGYASRLAVAIWEKHYKDAAPQWKPLDDMMGVLTQIDNMTSGLTRLAQQAEPVQEPVAWMYTGVMSNGIEHGPHLIWKPESMDAMSASKGVKAAPLYTAPPKLVPLTEEEAAKACGASGNLGPLMQIVRAVERAHGIGDNT